MPKATSKSDKIVYPAGCKEINEELNKDELIKRLKVGLKETEAKTNILTQIQVMLCVNCQRNFKHHNMIRIMHHVRNGGQEFENVSKHQNF